MKDYAALGSSGTEMPFDPYDDPRPAAKTKLLGPGIGLIITGVLCFMMSIYSAIDAGRVKGQLRETSLKIQKIEGMQPNQKKFWKDALLTYEKAMPIMNGVYAVLGAVVGIGGYQMLTLSGRTYCFLSCIISFIPLATGCCCFLGLIFGIWGIFMLMMPDVKAAFAMNAYVSNRKAPE